MDALNEQAPARMVAGALAHLAMHMETGCPRSARLATMLLTRVASDPEADEHLRHHAWELVEILERDERHEGLRGGERPAQTVAAAGQRPSSSRPFTA